MNIEDAKKIIEKIDFKLLLNNGFKQYEHAHNAKVEDKGSIIKRMDRYIRDAILNKLNKQEDKKRTK